MILGIGSDLCDTRRVEETIARFGDRFLNRCFTDVERRKSDRRAERAASYAKRFAAKEACAKALGTGIRSGVFWRDMGVVNMPSGQPTMALTGGAAHSVLILPRMVHLPLASHNCRTFKRTAPPELRLFRAGDIPA